MVLSPGFRELGTLRIRLAGRPAGVFEAEIGGEASITYRYRGPRDISVAETAEEHAMIAGATETHFPVRFLAVAGAVSAEEPQRGVDGRAGPRDPGRSSDVYLRYGLHRSLVDDGFGVLTCSKAPILQIGS